MKNTQDKIEVKVYKISDEFLNTLITECNKELLNSKPHLFQYPVELKKPMCDWANYCGEINRLNNSLLEQLNNHANLYAIHIKEKDSVWKVAYIGQRKSNSMRSRIIEHLVKKNAATGSKLNEVKAIVASGGEIGITFTKVEPEALRLFVEETLIQKNGQMLIWNIQK